MNFILGVWLALCHVASKARTSMRELSSTRMSGRARSSSRDSDGGSPSTRDEESGDSPTTPRTPKSPKSPPRTLTEVTILTFGTVEQVMKSKFMIAQAAASPSGPRQHLCAVHPPCASPPAAPCQRWQVVFNTIGSLAGPTMCFWLIFDLGGDPPYEWWGPQVMGIIILTNFISGILCNVLGPLGLVRPLPGRCPALVVRRRRSCPLARPPRLADSFSSCAGSPRP